jgi:hypothetical protein
MDPALIKIRCPAAHPCEGCYYYTLHRRCPEEEDCVGEIWVEDTTIYDSIENEELE